ncbi:uncharacterized protein LOC100371385 [Saccoglossus kowalevskii]|uniref:Uncharacterized protein LOC100371385 isoform X1 n=1 Tax=Saccoglossus kowalevskii TaxID=10224 RepID=A0ABM0MXY0_SACKO|nr:PREDICTED: uncharacterized protein LOC100371385 isoform X1 [Saccoglossus kowalevskii]XP_006824872.1 PREDICTED: uncharacterized protein LOC100371385 isoform X2 [Saccoglossus kowalevskii]
MASRKLVVRGMRLVLALMGILVFVLLFRHVIKPDTPEFEEEETRKDFVAGALSRSRPKDDKLSDMVMPQSDTIVVPKVVHFIWLEERSFKFHHLLSIKSAFRHIRPKEIWFHTNVRDMEKHTDADSVQYWKEAKTIPNFKIVPWDGPKYRSERDYQSKHYLKLAVMMEMLRDHGGIYLDLDVIVLKSFELLCHFEFVIGREDYGLSTAVVLARPKAPFLEKWYQWSHEPDSNRFEPEDALFDVAMQYPELVHVEENGFRRRDAWKGPEDYGNLFHGEIDLSDNYAVKLHYGMVEKEYNPEEIKSLRSSFGAMARLSYYASPTLGVTDWRPPRGAKKVVPNIIHYVWFTPHEFRYHHFLGVKSVVHIQKADRILFHTDAEPAGQFWWEEIKRIAGPILEVVHCDQPNEVFGHGVGNIPHKSDISRMQILLQHGGIYLDSDTMIVKNMEPLLYYPYSMGMEIVGLNNGIILSAPNSTFLNIYYNSYKFFDDAQWNWNSVMEPYRLAAEHPDHIHIETSGISRPHWTDWWDMRRAWRHEGKLDWSHAFAFHWIYSYHGNEHNPEEIRCFDDTFGEVARWIYYGSPELMCDPLLTFNS